MPLQLAQLLRAVLSSKYSGRVRHWTKAVAVKAACPNALGLHVCLVMQRTFQWQALSTFGNLVKDQSLGYGCCAFV